MNNKQALDIVIAMDNLAKALDIKLGELAGELSFFHKEALQEALDKYNAFIKLSVADRARALGYEVEQKKDGSVEVSATL